MKASTRWLNLSKLKTAFTRNTQYAIPLAHMLLESTGEYVCYSPHEICEVQMEVGSVS